MNRLVIPEMDADMESLRSDLRKLIKLHADMSQVVEALSAAVLQIRDKLELPAPAPKPAPPAERYLVVPTAGGTCKHCGEPTFAYSGHYCKPAPPAEPCFTCEGEQGLPPTRTVRICERCFGEGVA